MKAAFEKINGYQWVEFDESLITVFENLDTTPGVREIFDGECSEIYGPLELDKVDAQHLSFFLLLVCDKLEHGGKLILGGTEIVELTKNILNFTLDHKTVNSIIYSKAGLHSLNLVTDILLEKGMKIIKKQINGLNFLIEAQRV